jgi:pSer/pThr/pTyr-binding forkhead associated (FHA) protein
MFSLGLGGASIGRAPENVVALTNDTTVSRRHAHIAEENGQHVVYDDGSSNGTFVNRVRVSVQALAVGDVIQFGSSSFRYE